MDYVELIRLVCQVAGIVVEDTPGILAMIDRATAQKHVSLDELAAAAHAAKEESAAIQRL